MFSTILKLFSLFKLLNHNSNDFCETKKHQINKINNLIKVLKSYTSPTKEKEGIRGVGEGKEDIWGGGEGKEYIRGAGEGKLNKPWNAR